MMEYDLTEFTAVSSRHDEVIITHLEKFSEYYRKKNNKKTSASAGS